MWFPEPATLWLPASRQVVDPGDPLLLARMLADDLANWPPTAWLVLEDYHHVSGPPAEALIETLVLETPLRVVLQARRRPVWASSRRILYGEIAELSRHDLAMNDLEALELLPEHGDADSVVGHGARMAGGSRPRVSVEFTAPGRIGRSAAVPILCR